MTITIPAVRVGRLESHSSGRGWQVRIDKDTVIDRQGEPLTAEEATEVLDQLDNGLARKWKPKQ